MVKTFRRTKNKKKASRGLKTKELSEKEKLLVSEFLLDFNAARAGRVTGYKLSQAYRVLARDDVQVYLSEQTSRVLERNQLTADDIVEHLRTALYLDPNEIGESIRGGGWRVKRLHEVPKKIRQCMTKVKYRNRKDEEGNIVEEYWEVEFMSKDKALELAMKYKQLLRDKVDLTLETGPNLSQVLMEGEANGRGNIITTDFIEQVAKHQAKQLPPK